MREQVDVMQSTMAKNVATLQEMSNKNMKFVEESLQMAKKQADEKQKEMVEIVKGVQERNAKLAKGKCDSFIFAIPASGEKNRQYRTHSLNKEPQPALLKHIQFPFFIFI